MGGSDVARGRGELAPRAHLRSTCSMLTHRLPDVAQTGTRSPTPAPGAGHCARDAQGRAVCQLFWCGRLL